MKREIKRNGVPSDQMANIVAGYLHSKGGENKYEYETDDILSGEEMNED